MADYTKQQIFDIITEYLETNGSVVGNGKVRELKETELTDDVLSALTIPSVMSSTQGSTTTEEWVQTSLKNMMNPITNAVSNLSQKEEAVATAIDKANAAASRAVTAAESTEEINENVAADEATRKANENSRISAETTRQSNETSRQNSETLRENAESSRNASESERSSAESARQDSENTRRANESERISAEKTRASNESSRQSNESNRITAENTRQTNENARRTNELTRIDNESTRISNENARKSNETQRESNEAERKSAETTRQKNENLRENSESVRQDAENARKSSETQREENEDERRQNETERIANEQTRLANEQTRKTNETARQTNTAAAIQNASTAADSAQTNADYAKTQGDYAKNLNEHPAYVAADGYWYYWDYGAQEYVKGNYGKGDDLDYSTMTASERQDLADRIAEEVAAEGGYAIIPLDGKELSPTQVIEKNSILSVDGVVYIANKQTQSLPFEMLVQDGKYVTQIYNGKICYVKESDAKSDDWDVWICKSEEVRFQGIEEEISDLPTIRSDIEDNRQGIADIDSLIPAAASTTNELSDKKYVDDSVLSAKEELAPSIELAKSALQLTTKVTVGGKEYTVSQLLDAVASLMEKKVVAD